MNFLSCRQLLNNSSVMLGNTAVPAQALMDRKKTDSQNRTRNFWGQCPCLTTEPRCVLNPYSAVFYNKLPSKGMMDPEQLITTSKEAGSLSHQRVRLQQTSRHQAACLSRAWRSCGSLGSHFLTLIFSSAACSSSNPALIFLTDHFTHTPKLPSLGTTFYILLYTSGTGVYTLRQTTP